MAGITPKENFLKLAHGGHPEYVPVFTMMGTPYLGEVADVMMVPPLYDSTQFVDGGTDMWGVKYIAAEGTARATMPDTGIVLLPEIEDWSKVLKFPKANEFDWEKTYEKQLNDFHIDRERSAVKVGPGLMPFQELVALMGFEGGLTALYTDPDEVKAMLNAMVDHIEPYFEKMLDVYKPDIWSLGDDTCAKTTPFFSPEIYEDIFKPVYAACTRRAVERGIPVDFHNCGRIDEFLPFMVDFGVKYTNPVQETNDIPALVKQYKGRMVFCGGWDWDFHMPKNYPEFDEEEIRESVRHSIDTYGKEGNYVFCGGVVGAVGDETAMKINMIVQDEVYTYGHKIYGYTGE